MIRTRMISAAFMAACVLAACKTQSDPPPPVAPTTGLSASAASEQFKALQNRAVGAMNASYVEYLGFLGAESSNFERIAARCTPGTVASDIDKATCQTLRAAAAFELIPLSEDAPLQERRAGDAQSEATVVVQECTRLALSAAACGEAQVIAALARARVPAARVEAARVGKISLDAVEVIDAFSNFADAAPDWANLTGEGAEIARRLTHSMCLAEARVQAQFLSDPRFQDISRSSRRALAAAARSQKVELTPAERQLCDADPEGGSCLNVLAGAIRANCPPE